MRINHLIIGTEDVSSTVNFYEQILGFSAEGTFIDTGTSKEGAVLNYKKGKEVLQLLIVPFESRRLPNPQHLAFEVDTETFQEIYQTAVRCKLQIRAEPALTSTRPGIGVLKTDHEEYEHFYILDPARVNVEIMKRIR